jgi:8-oxo-dGTP pyrophosphatase MutT (NUDIX family)/phosphoglycolate phosphatase-like HAD superfamily hydrolase
MKSYEIYLFDLDDTLISTFETATQKYYPKLAKLLGVSYPGHSVVQKHWGGDLNISLEKIFGGPVDYEQAMINLEKLHQEQPIKSFNGVERILNVLKKHKKFIGLYSSSYPQIMDLCIKNSLPVPSGNIDLILSTVEQGIAKPSPHTIYIMMEKYRQLTGKVAKLEQVLVIGDSVDDYLTAKKAKVDFAAVLTGPTPGNDFISAGLDSSWIFPSVKDVLLPPPKHGIVAIIKDELSRILLIQEARPGHPYIGHWSGPHGACENFDILEEETVVRETMEECGLSVTPLRKIYTRSADTKVKTVSFWEAKLISDENQVCDTSSREVGDFGWFDLDDIMSGKIPLYPGTKDFFSHYE